MPPTMDELRAELKRHEDAAFRRRIGMADPELASHADNRYRLHQGQRSHRPLSADDEYVGLAGERAFCDWMGVDLDTSTKPLGSGSINAKINGRTINVYTYRKPVHLLVEKGKAKADVYVLCRYRERDKGADLLGWATKAEVKTAPVRDVGGMGVVSHAIRAEHLRPIGDLPVWLGYERPGEQLTMFG